MAEENEPLTHEYFRDMAASAKQIHDDVKSYKRDQAEFEARLHAIEQQKLSPSGAPSMKASSLVVEEIMRQSLWDRLRSGDTKSGTFRLEGTSMAALAHAAQSKSLLSGTTFPDALPARVPDIYEAPRAGLSIFEILMTMELNSPSLEFVRQEEPSEGGGADYQGGDGELKAELDLEYAKHDVKVFTIAGYAKASEQVLADNAFLRAFIPREMLYRLRDKAQAELVGGSGGANAISGLETEATSFTPGSNYTGADAVGSAISDLQERGWNADAVILHPADWFALRSQKADDSNGDGHYIAGTWANPAAPSIWGVPVALCRAVTQGTAIVLDRTAAVILDRQSPTFEVGLASDDFIRNLVTMRAETRIGLAVFSPSAVSKFSLS